MTGNDIQEYNHVMKMADKLHFLVVPKGDKIEVTCKSTSLTAGVFSTISEVQMFLHGVNFGKDMTNHIYAGKS